MVQRINRKKERKKERKKKKEKKKKQDKHFLCKTRRTNFQTANILRWALVNAVTNFSVP
jgi:hypothetical protein